MKKLLTTLLFIVLGTQSFSGVKHWTYKTKVDSFTDEITSSAVFDMGGSNKYVVARCKDGDFDIYIGFGEYIGNDRRARAMYRVDKGAVQESDKWALSTEGTTIFAKDGFNIELATALINGKSKAVFRVYDYRDTPHEIVINLKGSTKSITRVMNDCNIGAKTVINGQQYLCTDPTNNDILNFRVERQNDNTLLGVEMDGTNFFKTYYKSKKVSDDGVRFAMSYGLNKLFLNYTNMTAQRKSWARSDEYVCK